MPEAAGYAPWSTSPTTHGHFGSRPPPPAACDSQTGCHHPCSRFFSGGLLICLTHLNPPSLLQVLTLIPAKQHTNLCTKQGASNAPGGISWPWGTLPAPPLGRYTPPAPSASCSHIGRGELGLASLLQPGKIKLSTHCSARRPPSSPTFSLRWAPLLPGSGPARFLKSIRLWREG